MADDTPLTQQRGAHADWRPIPDPTDRTTADLMREVGYLRQLLTAQIAASDKLVGSLRNADEKFENERDRRISEVKQESDRRLTEVATEREKALKIKEEADKEALRLDREIRQFKDEKAGNRTDDAVKALESQNAATVAAWQREHASLIKEFADYRAAQAAMPEVRHLELEQASVRGVSRAKEISFGQMLALATVVLTFVLVSVSIAALIIHG